MEDSELLKAIAQIVQAETKPINDRLNGIDKRLSTVEDHMGGMENELAGVKEHLATVEGRTTRTEVLLEQDVAKQINLLAEGHKAILDRLPEADELDGIRSRVRTLEHVVTEHTSEITALKRAN